MLIAALIVTVLLAEIAPQPASAAATPLPNFQVSAVFSGLDNPTDFAFADDGRVFVAEMAGAVKVFDDLDDPTPTTFADLQTKVYLGGTTTACWGSRWTRTSAANPYVSCAL